MTGFLLRRCVRTSLALIRSAAQRARALLLLSLLTGAGQASAQFVDLNGNGMSDIWEQIYGASGLSAAADSDGDGVTNKLESIAGTNPLDANSSPRMSPLAVISNTATVTMLGGLGKQYQLQTAEVLCGPLGSNYWMLEASTVTRTSSVVTLNASANVPNKFFRMLISDIDSDGDGVSDWEEYQVGLNPTNAVSSGQLDGNGQPLGDLAYVTGKLASQNVVTVVATDPTATQPDVGQAASALGEFTIVRGGFPLRDITVNLNLGGPGSGFAVEGTDHTFVTRPVTLPAGVSAQTVPVTPLANTNLRAPVVVMLKELTGMGYTVGVASNATIVIYPSPTPSGIGLTASYYTNSSTTYSNSANFNPANHLITRVDPTIDFSWGTSNSPPLTNFNRATVRWTGQVQPQYSETYYFEARSDDGVKLWVNDVLLIDRWVSQGLTGMTNTIALQAGVRYNIKLEYLVFSGTSPSTRLYWYSDSQPKQIIPSNRLYPSSVPQAPGAVTSPLEGFAFLGQPFSYNVTGANSPLVYSANGLPPGLNFNPVSGQISGTPSLAGEFQVMLTTSNSLGVGGSILNLTVFDTGSAVTREIWNGVPGTNIADIPIGTPANSTNAFGSLQGIVNYGDNYAERLRGYLTAPTTGNYYFWIAASDAAELWIANDSEPVNKVRRAWVTPGGTSTQQWNLQPKQKSGWLALQAGQKYYLEILHKAGVGSNDHWEVGWLLDATGTNNTPGGLVPSYVLSKHFDLPPSLIPGTLYTANMLAQAGAVSSAVGSGTLRVNPAGTQAILKYSNTALSSPQTARHIHNHAYLQHPSQIMFDIDDAIQQPDGSYIWDIVAVGTLTPADIREIIAQGKAYINIHSVNYPNGEISGNFTLAQGSQIFTPPPPPPAWADDHASSNAAARFLIQASYGPSPAEIAAVQALGYEGWISNQFTIPPTLHLPNVLTKTNSDPGNIYPGTLTFNTWWERSITAPDQLRQRVAFALSQIMVVSESGVLDENARALSSYYDMLLENSFGNFRELLEAVTLHPAMGRYLDMWANQKGSVISGLHPNENYAREILQLFSIGLYRMWPDGTLIMNSQGNVIPTYTQDEILGFSRVFTGWHYYQTNQAGGRLPANFPPGSYYNYSNSMTLVPSRHEFGTKRLLDNVVRPAAWNAASNAANLEYDLYALEDLEVSHDSIFYHDNVGPFICRQLIQRLVTSHPSREYVYRVVQKFNDNGAGVRGDMKAVIQAILLDYEARSPAMLSVPTYGKQREPVLRVTAAARAFPSPPATGGSYLQSGGRLISITTTNAHRVNTNDTVLVEFAGETTTNDPPTSQTYTVATITSPATFTVNAAGTAGLTYRQTGTTLTITNNGHGLTTDNQVYLIFTSGGASNGVYQVASVLSVNVFTVAAVDSANRVGAGFYPRWSGGSFRQSGTTITVFVSGNHGLNPGDSVSLKFPTGTASPDGQYTVVSLPSPTQFTVTSLVSANTTDNNPLTFPLVPPIMNHSGTNATVRWNTWSVNGTDGSLAQTPLNAPTVFNFYFPDYKFPGILSSAGLTTPEFQLTSDTSAIQQMNYLGGPIFNNGNNTNGLFSFSSGDGDITLDIGPWMTPGFTSNAGLPGLVDALNTLLCAGQLSAAAKTQIVNYATTLTNANPHTQMRDRIRAAIHLIITSPEYTIQR